MKADRYFTLRYHADGRRVEEALGWASDGWTLKRAQEELIKLRGANRTGEGFVTLREKRAAELKTRQERAEQEATRERLERTVSDLWDRYSKEVVAVTNKPRTAAEKARMWNKRIKPALGALKLKDVTEEDVGAVVRAPLRLDASGQVVGGKGEGGNLYRLLNHMFSKALGWGMRPKDLGNPLDNVAEPKVSRRERLLADGEIGALLKALDRAEASASEPLQVLALFRMAILTGARISELLRLKWEHVRREEMELHLPDTKSGFSRRPVAADVLTIVDRIERMPGSPYVFRSNQDPAKRLSYSSAEKAFGRVVAAAGLTGCTLHTIRHWFATMTANSVSNPRVGMALTGHKSVTAYLNYVHGNREQARNLAKQLGQHASGLGKAASNVTSLAKSAG